MPFKLEAASEPVAITLKQGPMRGGSNEIGITLFLAPEEGILEGNIHFGSCATEIKSKKELAEAIEKAVNEVFKISL